MLDIKFIRDNQETVKKAIRDKALGLDLDKLLAVDEQRRSLTARIDELRNKRKSASENRDHESGKKIKNQLGDLEKSLVKVMEEFRAMMLLVPNVPSADSPIGGEKDFKIVEEWGERPKFDFEIQDHIALGKNLDLLDLTRGVKVAGFRGYFLKNEGALLHLGVLWYAFRKMVEKGFVPMITPTIIREFALFGSGHFPFGREEVYELEEFSKEKEKEIKFLAGTAEPSLLAYHSDEILEERDLPVKICGFSPCYRREVGGYGKDTKGIYRIHEFMKVEQVVLCKNDLAESEKWHHEMGEYSKELLRELDLPHRVIQIATGDMGAGKYKMYDIETWMPGRGAYGETHSNSNLTDWQSRRLNLRYKDKTGKMQFVHALNNTVIASPRILIAILENHQQKDGSVKIPKVLRDFVGSDKIKPKNA